jgi:endo-1,4-beta-xylanase
LWGFTDKYSWVPGFFDGQGSATPMNEQLQPKPAYDTLKETFELAS